MKRNSKSGILHPTPNPFSNPAVYTIVIDTENRVCHSVLDTESRFESAAQDLKFKRKEVRN